MIQNLYGSVDRQPQWHSFHQLEHLEYNFSNPQWRNRILGQGLKNFEQFEISADRASKFWCIPLTKWLGKTLEYHWRPKTTEHSDTKKLEAINNLKLSELYLKNNDVEKSTKILNDIRDNYADDVEIMEKIEYIYGLMMKK